MGLSRLTGQRRITKLLESCADVGKAITDNARFVHRGDFGTLIPGETSFPEREALLARARRRSQSVIGQTLFFDQRGYMPSLLARLDKVSMSAALECRVPFLDPELLAWSESLADKWKLRPGRSNKYIVKKAAEKWLPRDLIYRRKVGFGTPVGEWFKNPHGLGRYFDLLTDTTYEQRGHFNPTVVARFIDEHRAGTVDHSEALWGLLNLELWCRKFIDACPPVDYSTANRIPVLSES